MAADMKVRAADAPEPRKDVLAPVECRVVERAYGLQGDDTRFPGGVEHLLGFGGGAAERLLDDDVLAAGDAGERLVVVERVGARVPPCSAVKLWARSASRESVPINAAPGSSVTTSMKSQVIGEVPMVAIRSMGSP